MMTDPISDMLTRIRNANLRRQETVQLPVSKMKLEIAKILKREGFIKDFEVIKSRPVDLLQIRLRYLRENQPVITNLKRVSLSGRRVYVGKDEIPYVRGGIGVAILSTPKGILTDRESRKEKIGGEVLCMVW